MINRYSSRRQVDYQSFLAQRLKGARRYDRIAGYFSSSILEVAGEALDSLSGNVRVVCNSDLDVRDVETAKAAQIAMRQEWCASKPEEFGEKSKNRFTRLFQFLKSGKLQVKVIPNQRFGLIHGKAGVIEMADERKTCFMGSSNETYAAWKLNYELTWEDESAEGVAWVQEEFDALWNDPHAVPLAEFIIEDIERISHRTVISAVSDWKKDADPAAPVIEAPVYREEIGLWQHQKYFVKLAFDAHKTPHGARYILADQVGLGKTLQLAIASELMALWGDKPVLIIVPKTLMLQWQDEMRNLLDMPSARWDGKKWIDEMGIEYPDFGSEGILRCPRRVGIVSQSILVHRTDAAQHLKDLDYECVIVDESHRARRRNLQPGCEREAPEPNNLMRFLLEIAPRTRSLLLATATPVQLNPIEAWDLLNLLSRGSDVVFGNAFSNWRRPHEAMPLVLRQQPLPDDDVESWRWMKNPLPPAGEDRDYELLRRSLKMSSDDVVAPGNDMELLRQPDWARIKHAREDFAANHNPFIRHIIRRTREYLENTIDPETNEPYLKPVKVELFGESEAEAIQMTPYLADAYQAAEDFCKTLGARMRAAGFLKTLLLRRTGSSVAAGKITAERMLANWQQIPAAIDDDEEDELPSEDQGRQDVGQHQVTATTEGFRSLTDEERTQLQRFLNLLKANQESDPKYQMVREYLIRRGWLKLGCIVFSQYYDSIHWLAEQLTKELPQEIIGVYAGGNRSGIWQNGLFASQPRDEIKKRVARGEIRLLLGTDAASEGLNLQRLGTLINLDLPWNPTRLEQRKGRIQRIGQIRDTVFVYNMRYTNSVEDRVHHLLSQRLQSIHRLFGQIPDVLEDVWIQIALGDIKKAEQTINELPEQHPFELKFSKVEKVPWETCSTVLQASNRKRHLNAGWGK
ncbi:MAG: DEAD/DEAH box helicase family protein [Verrucomicrobia bacterium]|nr:DEAD/DEAH box helicase family protein [Verrucomicrobiota bacterium]